MSRSARRVWLFDLDNTLHDANPHIFPHINHAMRQYIERHLGLDEEAANRLRQNYWLRYGATLLGLMRHHGTNPDHFLGETHRFADLPGMLVFNRAIRSTLRRLPGRKIVFSNAPRQYAENILALTRLESVFDAVYAIENLRFQPKPMLAGFRTLLRAERLDPRRCILVEDTLANLESAKRLGMHTVWVNRNPRNSPSVDVKIGNLLDLPRRLASL